MYVYALNVFPLYGKFELTEKQVNNNNGKMLLSSATN